MQIIRLKEGVHSLPPQKSLSSTFQSSFWWTVIRLQINTNPISCKILPGFNDTCYFRICLNCDYLKANDTDSDDDFIKKSDIFKEVFLK